MEPHVYEISSLSYKGLAASIDGDDGENQSILVSGESGAGKFCCVMLLLALFVHSLTQVLSCIIYHQVKPRRSKSLSVTLLAYRRVP